MRQNEPVQFTVEAQEAVRDDADRFLGINLNYIRDRDENRPGARPLARALREMGVRWLRFPGGEKSDFHLWSLPPYGRPAPVSLGSYARFPGARMDFDQFIRLCREVRAEPFVVVGYDSAARTGRSKEQWLADAVAWVRYANRERRYDVRWWEIGNENWHNQTARPEEMAGITAEFSRAMKAMDPAIRVGASGNNLAWWSEFLPRAAPHLDYVTLSLYNTWEWKGYDRYLRKPPPDLVSGVREALGAIDRFTRLPDRSRLRVVVTETNSKDFSEGGWPGNNTLGHALVTWETLGRLMELNRVASAMVWTTRWMDDSEAAASQWYALGPRNEVLPTGLALSAWGPFLLPRLLRVTGGNDQVTAFASGARDGRRVTVWVLNRGRRAAGEVQIRLSATGHYESARLRRLAGKGPEDTRPAWSRAVSAPISGNLISLPGCPPTSITVLEIA